MIARVAHWRADGDERLYCPECHSTVQTARVKQIRHRWCACTFQSSRIRESSDESRRTAPVAKFIAEAERRAMLLPRAAPQRKCATEVLWEP